MSKHSTKRLSPRTVAAAFLKILAGVLLVCVLAVIAALLWLRTESAADFIAETLTGQLAAQGLELRLGRISAVLPQSVAVHEIALSDADGVFFQASGLTLAVKPSSLFKGRLEIAEIRLDMPEVIRLPRLLASQEPPQESNGDFSAFLASPPLGIRIDLVALRQGRVHAAVLRPQDAPDTVYSLELSGAASLEGGSLAAGLTLAFLHPDGTGLKLELELDAASGIAGANAEGNVEAAAPAQRAVNPGEDSLRLSLEAREAEKGALALLLGEPDLPAYAFSLKGNGPVRDWQGELSLLAGKNMRATVGTADGNSGASSPKAGMLTVISGIALQCRTGSLWRDAVAKPDFSLVMSTGVTGGPDTPASVTSLLGAKAHSELSLSARDKTYAIDVSASGDFWRLAVIDARVMPVPAADGSRRDAGSEAGKKGLAVDAKIEARVSGQAQPPAGKGAASPALPELALTSVLSGIAHGDVYGLEAAGTVTLADAGLSSAAPPGSGPGHREEFETRYSLRARMNGPHLTLDSLRLDGVGIVADASAGIDASTRAVRADASIRAADHAEWQILLGRASGLASPDNPRPLAGALSLALSLDLPASAPHAERAAASRPATGALLLEARDMRWPTPLLNAALGASIDASARLSGSVSQGSAGSWTLHLDRLAAGILQAQGEATLVPESVGSFSLADKLTASLRANISNIAPLVSPGSATSPAPVSGPVAAAVTVEGALDAPRVSLAVSSPALVAADRQWKALSLTVNADTALTDKALSAAGELALTLGQSPGGPLALSGQWQTHLPQGARANGKKARISLKNVSMRGAGIEGSADLAATLPLAAEGAIRAEIRDWSALSALTGVPLSGGPAALDARFAHGAKGQEALIQLQLASVRMKKPGNESATFFLRDVSAVLNASGLPQSPVLDVSLETGRGMAGPLRWNSGTGSIQGNGHSGTFDFALLNRGKRARASGKSRAARPLAASADRQGASRGATDDELFVLQGAYDLNTMDVLLSTLAMRQRKSGTGLQLRTPLTVNVARGMRMRGLDMAFEPAGALTADADIAPGKLEVKARLESLPFSFFKLVTNSPLPDGLLQAEANVRTSPAGPQGEFSIRSRISATQDVSGVNAVDASAGSAVFEVVLNGSLAASPQANAIAGEGIRPLPGVVWLQGSGTLGGSGKPEAAREGRLHFLLPLRPGGNGLPLPDPRAPLAARLAWNGPVDSLWQIVPLPDRYLTGQTQLTLDVRGSMESPKVLVEAYMAGGRFQDIPNGILVNGINLEARNTGQGDVHALVAANDSQSGSLSVEASITGLYGGKEGGPAMALRGRLDDFSPLHRDDLALSLSGIFGLNGPLDALNVTSDIVVNNGEFTVSGNLGGSVPTLDVVNKKRADAEQSAEEDETEEVAPAIGPTLALRITVPRSFFIRGMGINSEWEGDLRINGTASAPSLTGFLKPVRGYLSLLSRSFTINEGEITFTGGMDINPALDLTLTNETHGLTAFIHATGSAKKPKLVLSSRPPLPQDEVLAMVLFGKRTSELSRFEAIQLANSMREFSGFGGSSLDMLTGVRKSVGLDMLRIGGSEGASHRSTTGQSGEDNLRQSSSGADASEAGAPTLEAGKYINDSIYVGVEQGATQESTAVRVEVELFPSVTLQGKSTSESSEVGIGWKMDY